jgi:type II restriction/modification system DNA methylase subunit YeeA
MNKANLKSYAPQARRDFIAAVTARANQLGLSNKAGSLEIAPAEKQGDVTVIAGQAWPAKIKGQRDKLIERIQKDGFDYTIEAVAYTWFNRFAALRYMEIHDYLGHEHRALSSTAGGLPDILANATDLASELPGLNAAKVIELKLAGNRDGELYRMLLVAQCNALSRAMPFLFERIDDDSELLLPDNLLRSDSVIAKLVTEIPEEDWAEVEIIGWLYQFYISEKKDQVIGKVVKSEDIPAATQLFTPNWIVQYLVQNSVGRLWLMANPQSTLVKEWPYYITPAEQTPEVQAQLDTLIQTRVKEDGDTLNPESITVLDPACGSGHILVVAYDVLKAIYLERGYQPRTIPRLILEKNLYGLDIDDRAAQMAGFALLMKARADDRRLFTATDVAGILQPPKLNVLSLQESKGLNVDDLANSLAPFKVDRTAVAMLVDAFEHAKTFGSLIQISQPLSQYLAFLPEALSMAKRSDDIYARAAADELLPLLPQAQVLAMQFDAVVANPPYMGGKGMNAALKDCARVKFPESKSDLFAMFMERGFGWCKPSAFNGMVTMQSWMFLSSFVAMRERLLKNRTMTHLTQMGSGVMGIAFGTAASIFLSSRINSYHGSFSYCDNSDLDRNGIPLYFPVNNDRLKTISSDSFNRIPGCPIAYWVTPKIYDLVEKSKRLADYGEARMGLATGDNNRFIRTWQECPINNVGFGIKSRTEAQSKNIRWFPYSKGGGFKKWYGNNEFLVDWYADGKAVRTNLHPSGSRVWAHNFNLEHIFRSSITWGLITSGNLSVRFNPIGFLFDGTGTCAFFKSMDTQLVALGLLNSNFVRYFSTILNPTMAFQAGDFGNIPIKDSIFIDIFKNNVSSLINIAKKNWDAFEQSWEFCTNSLIGQKKEKLEISFHKWKLDCEYDFLKMKSLEEENNKILNEAYEIDEDFNSSVQDLEITLIRADREKDSQRLISYTIGCMMGRYSLDEPGLIYAHAGNIGFNPDRYKTFPADADGIVPITDELWFDDDASLRIREFLLAVWGPDTLEENMTWLAESLGTKANETPDETIRRYIADKFFKDHLQTYKKRPIYWLFNSGKQGVFQALVYLHRYSEGTLARLRAEYVVPLTSKIQNRIEILVKDAAAASSTAARNKLNKEVESLKKKHVELLAYDEKLRHHADMRITLDLDDGVKVNYGKFGDLLAEVKAVTGGASDD